MNPDDLSSLSQTAGVWLLQFGLKALGAIALWIIGRRLIHFAVARMQRGLRRQPIEPTVGGFLGSTVALALAVAGCSTVSVNADWDPGADFASLHTWEWLDIARPATGNPRLDNPLLHGRIQDAIASGLRARGYAEATGEADFYVTYHLALESKLDARTIYTGYGPYRGWYGGGTETVVEQYDVGILLVDFISPKTQTVVWRGTAQSRVNESRDPAEREKRVRDAVTQLLAQFPPQPK